MSDKHDDGHHVNYMMIFGFLCGLTVLSVVADLVDLTSLHITVLIAVVMLIACVKASFVLRYFMHLKFEGKWKYVILLPTTVLALAIPFAIAPDIGLVYYDIDVPQQNTLLEEEQRAEKATADDAKEHDHDKGAAEHGDPH